MIICQSIIIMATARRVLLLSSSAVHGAPYLEYATNDIQSFFQRSSVQRILFVPYALKNHDNYAEMVRGPLKKMGYEVDSIHEAANALDAVNNAQAIFIGGGNTFQLLKTLYDKNLLEAIRKRVLEDGIPYMGSSAGSNVATLSICTTNDMPIVWPPSLNALGLETREQRITQYHELPNTPPVLGLREGAMLHVEGNDAKLRGIAGAKLFKVGQTPVEYNVGDDLGFLLG
ncbi:hypothetical protein B566_EDAN003013 [Ephemera danica]|nr:hypothetical protein B566_EDAN003013 [Ephemera danica]